MKKNNPIQQTLTLVKKDLLLELRQQYAFYGVLLYIVSTVFVINLMMGKPDDTAVRGGKCSSQKLHAGE